MPMFTLHSTYSASGVTNQGDPVNHVNYIATTLIQTDHINSCSLHFGIIAATLTLLKDFLRLLSIN